MKDSNLAQERAALAQIANARLYPSLTDPNFLVLRSRRIIFQKWIDSLPTRPLRILDVGGRYQPYRPLLEGRIAQYFALDILPTALVDVVGSGESLPFAPNSFDLAIATQVFEYFEAPRIAAQRVHEALKPRGLLLMSVAACAPRFVDEERWRFTPRGLRSVLADFTRVEIVPELTSIGGLVRTLNLGMHMFSHFRPVMRGYEFTMCPLLNTLGLILERLRVTKNDQFTPNYSVLAQK